MANIPQERTSEAVAAGFQGCELLASGQECYCEGTGMHSGVSPRWPMPGDNWEFRLPHMKAKRTKTVGSISQKEFIVERATDYPWKHKTAMLSYVNWQRENKGRYTGITVRRLMEFGQRISTKAERDARLQAQIEQARQKRAETKGG